MSTTFLRGPAGTGKTTQAVERLRQWLTGSVPPHQILVIVPQYTVAAPYRELLYDPTLPGSGAIEILTLNSLALRTIDIFWPLVAEAAGFARPTAKPVFLTIETAQYYLQQAIDPLLKEGYFDPNVVPITISLPRLMSQILDNLNKAALIGLPHTQVGERLAASLPLEPSRRVALEHTQRCVNRFREFCLARNLLDFSLRIETFYQHMWPEASIRRYLVDRYRYLVVDNIEEDTPFAHTILKQWLPHTEAALVVYDEEAGYRIFLGANRRTAESVADLCDETVRLADYHVPPPDMIELGEQLAQALTGQRSDPPRPAADPRRALTFEQKRFYPQMLDWLVDRIETMLNEEAVSPDEMVVLAPFVSDALRFAFLTRMAERGLPVRSHRPSRPLSEEPAAKTMLILARLIFDEMPQPFDLALALHQAIDGLDLVRANLLAQVVCRREEMTAFEQIEGEMRNRIGYRLGARYDDLHDWLHRMAAEKPLLDHFFNRLFDELLSQPGYGFHRQVEAGQAAARLIESARRFRRIAEQVPHTVTAGGMVEFPDSVALNRAYIETINRGILAGQYLPDREPTDPAVLITPATTFLMSNRPVDYQFWLDAGSSGWWERIAQPLTHPYILAADWEPGRLWSDEDEVAHQRDRLYRLVLGLTRRCRKQVILVNAEIGEQGYEQRGQLLMALQQTLRRLPREAA